LRWCQNDEFDEEEGKGRRSRKKGPDACRGAGEAEENKEAKKNKLQRKQRVGEL